MKFQNLALVIILTLTLGVIPASACTGIKLKTRDGAVIQGRTVEFGISIDATVTAIPRGHAFVGKTPKGDGLEYTAKYGAVGTTAFGDVNLMDGLNEAGLSVGTFYFPTFAEYTPVTPGNQAKALSQIDFPNWLLTRFASVEEVRRAVERGDVIVAPTVLKGWGPQVQPFHYGVWDNTGAGIVIEPIGGRLVIHDNPIGVITNSPNFDWHMTNLRNYIALDPNNVRAMKIDGETLEPLGQGSGMLGLPGDFTPPSRFVRAAVFSVAAIPSDTAEKGVEQAFHILNNFDIPIGVARAKEGDVVHCDYTLMTMVRDMKNLRYYFKSYEDQTIRMIDLKKLDWNAKTIKTLSPKGSQPIVDVTKKLK